MVQLPSHPIADSVSLPEYGPIPSAPGIHSLPVQCTQLLKPGDAAVKTLTMARVSTPMATLASAAAAIPLGAWARGVHAISTAPLRLTLGSTIVLMVSLSCAFRPTSAW